MKDLEMDDIIAQELSKEIQPLSAENEAFRRGFHQGFYVGRNVPRVTDEQVRAWRYGDEHVGPPGTMMEGRKF